MKLPLIKKSFTLKLLLVTLLFSALESCKKNEVQQKTLAQSADAVNQKNIPLSRRFVQESADVVYQWYRFIATLQLPASPQPVVLANNRNFAYIGIGLYEAVQPGIIGARSLSSELYQMPSMPKPDMSKDYLWSASANAALATMFKLFLTGLSPAAIASISAQETTNYNQFKSGTPDDVLLRSQAFGRSIAEAIYNWSTSDNFNLSSVGYTIPVFPGAWVPTPPAFLAPVGPYLKDSRPLLKYSLTATAPPIPVPYSEDPSSGFYKAAKEVYDVGVALTAEQKAIANWWADAGGSGVGVPAPYHILAIVTNLLEGQQAQLWKAAEVYAKTGIGLKDGPINTFRAKYQYNLVRPVTYIRQKINANWQSYLPSPPYPEYTSGLISNYGPVIQVLIRELGDIPVTDNAYTWRGLSARTYTSLTQLLKEAAVSRVYAGIHYQFTQDVSIEMGRKLGNEIANIQIVGPKY
jgi:hypothetical protein